MMTLRPESPNREIVAEALRVANIPSDRLARKGSGLSGVEIVFYRTLLCACPQQGSAPSLAELHAAARDLS